MLFRSNNVFLENGVFAPAEVIVRSGKIESVREPGAAQSGDDALDLDDQYLIPGLVDIHTHGAMGADFSDGTAEAAATISAYLAAHGITSFLGTTMSLPEETLSRSCVVARQTVNRSYPRRATLRGINLEGPFLSKAKCGAQNPASIIAPDYGMFLRLDEASGASIRIVDVAPEAPGALDFIANAAAGRTVSLAHSGADYDTASAAYAAGASHATHLFNGMAAYSHKEPGVVGAALDFAAHVELICDGQHVHPSVVRMVFTALGPARVCLISDSMRACGMPDGTYDLGGQAVTVANRRATIETGSLAGSVTNLFDCMAKAISFGIPRETAVLAATRNPAVAAGIYDRVGSVTPGKAADLLILNPDFSLAGVVQNGVLTR